MICVLIQPRRRSRPRTSLAKSWLGCWMKLWLEMTARAMESLIHIRIRRLRWRRLSRWLSMWSRSMKVWMNRIARKMIGVELCQQVCWAQVKGSPIWVRVRQKLTRMMCHRSERMTRILQSHHSTASERTTTIHMSPTALKIVQAQTPRTYNGPTQWKLNVFL